MKMCHIYSFSKYLDYVTCILFGLRKEYWGYQYFSMFKQAGMEHYRRNMTEASEYVDKALDLVNKAQYRHQMKARIFYTISAIHRENRQFGKAKFWLDRAKEVSHPAFIIMSSCWPKLNSYKVIMRSWLGFGAIWLFDFSFKGCSKLPC